MNFYQYDYQQDMYFIEIRNRFELIQWLYTDNDHFIENFADKINKDVLKKLFVNSKNLKKYLNQTKRKMNRLNGVHLECAQHIQQFVEVFAKEYDFTNIKNINSDCEDTKFTNIIHADVDFRNSYTKYLRRKDIEYWRNKAFADYGLALSAMLDFINYLGVKADSELAEEKRNDLLRYFQSAQKRLQLGKRMMSASDDSYLDCMIVLPENNDAVINKFKLMQCEYNSIVEELFFVQKEYFAQFQDGEFPLDAETKLFEHQSNQYIAKMNEVGFEMNLFILNLMNVEVPDFYILSPLTYENHFEHLYA